MSKVQLGMRWTIAEIGLASAALVIASTWMAWVVSQGTNQVIQPGWWAFRYAAPLLVALLMAVAAFAAVRFKPPVNQTAGLAIGVVSGLEILLFGVVWYSLAVMPFPS